MFPSSHVCSYEHMSTWLLWYIVERYTNELFSPYLSPGKHTFFGDGENKFLQIRPFFFNHILCIDWKEKELFLALGWRKFLCVCIATVYINCIFVCAMTVIVSSTGSGSVIFSLMISSLFLSMSLPPPPKLYNTYVCVYACVRTCVCVHVCIHRWYWKYLTDDMAYSSTNQSGYQLETTSTTVERHKGTYLWRSRNHVLNEEAEIQMYKRIGCGSQSRQRKQN